MLCRSVCCWMYININIYLISSSYNKDRRKRQGKCNPMAFEAQTFARMCPSINRESSRWDCQLFFRISCDGPFHRLHGGPVQKRDRQNHKRRVVRSDATVRRGSATAYSAPDSPRTQGDFDAGRDTIVLRKCNL